MLKIQKDKACIVYLAHALINVSLAPPIAKYATIPQLYNDKKTTFFTTHHPYK